MFARTRLQELGPTARRRALWGALGAVLLLVSAMALGQAERVQASLVADATTSAEALVDAALAPVLTPTDAAVPATGTRYATLAGAVESQVLTDGTVRTVTIWAADGTILFAGDVSLVGDEVRAMRPTVLSVIGDEPRSDVSRGLLRSFVPIELAPGVSVAVELDRSADPVSSAADPWRLLALVAAAGALLSWLLLARTFTRYGRRAEGFDEDVLRAAVAGRRRAERAYEEAASRRDAIAAELDLTRETLHQTEQRARDAARTADDTPRLREHLLITAEDLKRAEQERDALRQRLVETGRAVEAEAARGREEVAGALAEIERLEGVKLSLQDRAAKAEEAVAELTKQVAELSARPDVEAELASTRREVEATLKDLAAARERAEQAERRSAELEGTTDEMGARIRDLERRPDLSAKLDAAAAALDIAREQIRALTARADASDAEAMELRAEVDRKKEARSKALEQAKAALAKARSELESTGAELRSVMAENAAVRDEVESLRRESDAAGQMIADSKAELLQTTELAKALASRVKEAETALEQEREAWAAALEEERVSAGAELERTRAEAAAEIDLVHANAAAERDELVAELDVLAAERDLLAAERTALSGTLDALHSERDSSAEGILLARRQAEELRSALAHGETQMQDLRSTAEAERVRTAELETERDAARAESERAREELKGARTEIDRVRDEAERARAALEIARSEAETERAELRTEQDDVREAHARAAQAEVEAEEAGARAAETGARIAEAEARASAAEGRAAEALARAALADELLTEAEHLLRDTRFAKPARGEGPVTVASGPERFAVEVEPEHPVVRQVNGSRPARPTAKVEVDTLVRRMVQESWSDRGRMVSVYAEPVVVEAAPGTIESIVQGLLEGSVARTAEGHRIVLHVERAEDGAMLSVEDGRPPDPEAVSAETRRLAAELGGWANVEERPGGGAILRVYLPRSEDAGAIPA